MLSIIVVSKDRQEYISRQIIELNSLSLKCDFEVIFFDDGSDSQLVINDALFKYEIHRSEKNLGLIEARNQAVKLASDLSQYLFFLDDDIFVHGLFDYLQDAMVEINKGYLAVSLPFINLPTYKYEQLSTFKHIWDLTKRDDDCVYFFGGTSVFSTNLFNKLGGLEGLYRIYLEEEDLALRAYCSGYKMKVLYGNNYIGIHDQAGGKNWEDRTNFLLSNRLAFHYKYVGNPVLRCSLDVLYLLVYLVKLRSIKKIFVAIKRRNDIAKLIIRKPVGTNVFLRFMIKRYFNF